VGCALVKVVEEGFNAKHAKSPRNYAEKYFAPFAGFASFALNRVSSTSLLSFKRRC
jgi:hypothetical protein